MLEITIKPFEKLSNDQESIILEALRAAGCGQDTLIFSGQGGLGMHRTSLNEREAIVTISGDSSRGYMIKIIPKAETQSHCKLSATTNFKIVSKAETQLFDWR